MSALWWPRPEAGDLVWCHFPLLPPHLSQLQPGPEQRPALIVRVIERNPHYRVFVVYGTSQKSHIAAQRRVLDTQGRQHRVQIQTT